ncbi:Uma2 family endonuclease [Myxococcota bacterium]|nr:Uma2 family endonuclease [Myxococcota bacterium]
MGEPAKKSGISYAEYLERLEASEDRLEFVDGEIFAMAGGTPEHSYVGVRVTTLLSVGLQRSPCRTFNSDLRVRIDDDTILPDATVICGPRAPHPGDPNAATNPTLIVEVLSPSTALWDRSGKFMLVQRIPSLQHYVLVSPERRTVEHYRRDGDGWRYTLATGDTPVVLDALSVTLTPNHVFEGLDDV